MVQRRSRIAASARAPSAPPAGASVDSMVDGLAAVLWEADLETGELLYVSESVTALLGYPARQWRDRAFVRRVIHAGDLDAAIASIVQARAANAPARVDVRILRADHRWVWTRTVATTVLVIGGRHRLRGVTLDITAEKRDEVELRRQASVDALTGLMNRSAFEQVFDESLARAQTFAIMMLDLDGFKQINDQHGHDAGDEVLRVVGERLDSLGADVVAARLGGDEFVLLVRGASRADVLARAEHIRDMIARPIDPLGLTVSASLGIALHPGHGARAPILLRCADAAMYRSKGVQRAVIWEGAAIPPAGRPSRRRVGRGLLLGCIAFAATVVAPAAASLVSAVVHMEREPARVELPAEGSLEQIVSDLLADESLTDPVRATSRPVRSELAALLASYGVPNERLEDITEAVARRLLSRLQAELDRADLPPRPRAQTPSPDAPDEPVAERAPEEAPSEPAQEFIAPAPVPSDS